MKTTTTLFAAALTGAAALLGVGACNTTGSQRTGGADAPGAQDSAELRRALLAYFECEECTDGELQTLLKFGERATPSLAAALRQGPSLAKREQARLAYEAAYEELTAYARAHPKNVRVPMTKEQYLGTYLGNYEVLHKTRAARALAEIGGPEARAALQQALGAEKSEEVKRVVAESLARVRA